MTTVAPFRPDMERLRRVNAEERPSDRLRAHFDVERSLAARLRESSQEQRSRLYSELYTELFAHLPDHPQHKADPERRRRNTANQVAFLRPLLSPNSVYVEVGCGDAAVTQGIAAYTREAIGVDVTAALVDQEAAPANFRFVQTNGTDLPLETSSADLVYSNQLMEHLHPDDAKRQLQEVCRVLRPGAQYICSTPNRVTGPHDISGYFGHEPVGFHMREYDHASLAGMFRDSGFRSSRAQVTVKGRRLMLPVGPLSFVERVLMALPVAARSKLTSIGPVRNLAGVVLIGIK